MPPLAARLVVGTVLVQQVTSVLTKSYPISWLQEAQREKEKKEMRREL